MSVRQGSSDALAEAVRVLKPGGAGAGQEGDAEVRVEQATRSNYRGHQSTSTRTISSRDQTPSFFQRITPAITGR